MKNCRSAMAVKLLAGLFLALLSAPAQAQFGPVMSAAGGTNRSMGGASTAAPISAAGALYWNPATMSALEHDQMELGAELILPQARMSSFVPANTFGPGVPPIDLQGQTEAEDSVFAIPTLALAFGAEDSSITYGLGVHALAGFGLNYPGSTTNPLLTPPAPVGLGFGPIQSEYQVVQIAPAIAWEVSEGWSVSFSPMLNIGKAQLDPLAVAAPDDANGDTFATYPNGTHSRSAWGGGFGLGTYYDAGLWRFGASYKSPQWFETYTFHTANELGVPRTVDYRLNIPQIVSIGTSYVGFEGVTLAADVRYLDYANTEGFGDSGFNPDGSLSGLGLKSIFAVALGAQFQVTDRLTTQVGYTWSENPVSSRETMANIASPLVIQNMVSMGLSYQATDALALTLAYTHAFENSQRGPITLPMGAIPGTYIKSSASVDMITLGAIVKFGPHRR
jgi:long-chain fatty acid transport protein